MKLSQISHANIFLCLLITIAVGVGTSNPAYFTVDISINCGSTKTSAAHSGIEWLGDMQPRFSSLLQLKGSSRTSTVIHMSTSADPVILHKTARLSRSQFSYLFRVNPGQKIIRLHFNPASYRGFEGMVDLFTVAAGPFTLLSNFSASLAADALGVDTFVKEFWLNLVDGSLGREFPTDEALRCIQVGLRCTLEHPHDRPTMRNVLKMLDGDALWLHPQQPWIGGGLHTASKIK